MYNRTKGGQRKLRNPSRTSPSHDEQFARDENPNGLAVWNKEGEEIVYINNLDDGLTQQQFDSILSKYFTPQQLDMIYDIPSEAQVVSDDEDYGNVDINHMTIKEYVLQLKQFLRNHG